MNDKLPLPSGFSFAYLTLYPNQDVHCYTTSKSNLIEQKSLGLSGAFSVYDPIAKKKVGSTDDGLIYTFWLNDIDSADLNMLQEEFPVVVMNLDDGQIYVDYADVPGLSTVSPPVTDELPA